MICLLVACGNNPVPSDTSSTQSSSTEPPKQDVIEIINGYIWVNGVNTGIKAEDCDHVWETVTTDPTCANGGYDTVTCKICDKSYTTNETAKLDHSFGTAYAYDDNYHWLTCSGCGEAKDKAAHTSDSNDICTVCQVPTTATPGVIYDISANGTYAEVIGYNGTATVVKIASEYKGLPVKSIYKKSFENNLQITSIIIPDSVETIGEYAFQNCYYLKSITLGSGIKSIAGGAFSMIGSGNVYISDISTWLNIVFENGISNPANSHDLYINNQLVTNLVIPNSITSINDYAFYGCSSLVSVEIPDGVTSIGRDAFSNCHNLESVVIPNSITSIDNYVFGGVNKLKFNEYENGQYLGNENNPYLILCQLSNKNMRSYEIHQNTRFVMPGVFASTDRLTDIYYAGTEADWNKIIILSDPYNFNSSNEKLINATKHFNYVPQ